MPALAETPRTVEEGDLLWTPPAAYCALSGVERFRHWVNARDGLDLADYEALRQWSVDELERFWAACWDYFDIRSETPYRRVLDRQTMPGARWFEGATLNYAEHLLRREADHPEAVVFHHSSELRAPATMRWDELGGQVRILAGQLRKLGIGPGDRVASYMPNVPETAIAMLATTAIGAIWAAASPEFGARAVIDRFAQIKPKLLFAVDGYRFAGQDFPREGEVEQILSSIDSLQHTVWLTYLHPDRARPAGTIPWEKLLNQPEVPRAQFRYERVGHDHPLWILFSSGTTGLPKAVVHSHVGVLLEHCKVGAFHLGLRAGSRPFFYSTTGWMMWNILLASLLQDATPVLYDGSPIAPDSSVLWRIAEQAQVTHLGISPGFVQVMQKDGLRPRLHYPLSQLEMILLVGSPSTPETFAWLYEEVKPDLWVTSQSGGTEIASAFVGASPTLPVHAGEIQARGLGMDVRVWDEQGQELDGHVGELVVTRPFPSMPLYFWNDEDGKRYHESYFGTYPGVWRHGDFIRINERGGCYILGRSDSMLNRYGVCIGTSEIYRSVERMEEILDSIIVCCELAGGRYFMPMFLKLRPGTVLDEGLRNRIARRLRADCSPRHVPDQMYRVEDIPYTLTGKKMEVPVRKILVGWPLEKAASRDAMMNPAAIDWFVGFRKQNRVMLTS
ncbi:acetoacetate--CoA ligase [Solimonas sp. K1W22B-7]|uniref:acetoacetate--CoA ligase n=1 Tax=Solimonas sp. K1W22B-7 TaxID=2303331 RepID=UPI000E335E5F|nr:acetoacetate--CoA ligase [Solimonas sp. K1W22B-7]AXQ27893.1 acetoacetate--CoA ligase [Solimonas sp. K1W22B-7]